MTCQTTWIQFSIRLSSCMFWAILDHGYKLRPNATPASDLDITEPFPTLPNHHLFIPNPPPRARIRTRLHLKPRPIHLLQRHPAHPPPHPPHSISLSLSTLPCLSPSPRHL